MAHAILSKPSLDNIKLTQLLDLLSLLLETNSQQSEGWAIDHKCLRYQSPCKLCLVHLNGCRFGFCLVSAKFEGDIAKVTVVRALIDRRGP